ncbi:hypothetical protein ACQY0O_002594 [Thecaphora frezii]
MQRRADAEWAAGHKQEPKRTDHPLWPWLGGLTSEREMRPNKATIRSSRASITAPSGRPASALSPTSPVAAQPTLRRDFGSVRSWNPAHLTRLGPVRLATEAYMVGRGNSTGPFHVARLLIIWARGGSTAAATLFSALAAEGGLESVDDWRVLVTLRWAQICPPNWLAASSCVFASRSLAPLSRSLRPRLSPSSGNPKHASRHLASPSPLPRPSRPPSRYPRLAFPPRPCHSVFRRSPLPVASSHRRFARPWGVWTAPSQVPPFPKRRATLFWRSTLARNRLPAVLNLRNSQPAIEPTSRRANQPLSQPAIEPTSHRANQPSSQPAIEPTSQPIHPPTHPRCSPHRLHPDCAPALLRRPQPRPFDSRTHPTTRAQHTHTHTHTHTPIHTITITIIYTPRAHTHTYAHTHIRTYAHTHTRTHAHTHTRSLPRLILSLLDTLPFSVSLSASLSASLSLARSLSHSHSFKSLSLPFFATPHPRLPPLLCSLFFPLRPSSPRFLDPSSALPLSRRTPTLFVSPLSIFNLTLPSSTSSTPPLNLWLPDTPAFRHPHRRAASPCTPLSRLLQLAPLLAQRPIISSSAYFFTLPL